MCSPKLNLWFDDFKYCIIDWHNSTITKPLFVFHILWAMCRIYVRFFIYGHCVTCMCSQILCIVFKYFFFQISKKKKINFRVFPKSKKVHKHIDAFNIIKYWVTREYEYQTYSCTSFHNFVCNFAHIFIEWSSKVFKQENILHLCSLYEWMEIFPFQNTLKKFSIWTAYI